MSISKSARDLRWLLIFLSVFSGSLTGTGFGQDKGSSLPAADILSNVLESSGAPKAQAKEASEAVETYLKTGDFSELRPHALSSDPQVAALALSTSLADDHPKAKRLLFRVLKKDEGPREALLRCLSLVPTKRALRLLVNELDSANEAHRKAARFALTAISGERFTEDAEWKDWWAAHRRGIEIPEQTEMSEKLAALQQAVFGERQQAVMKVFQKHEKLAEVGEMLGGLFDDLAAAQARGRQARVSDLAKIADAAFRQGQLDAALKGYEAALEAKPDDLRSRYLLGCLLIEKERWEEATAELKAVLQAEPECRTAEGLIAYAARRQAHPDEPIAESLEEPFAGFKGLETTDIFSFETGDPLLDGILQRQMAQRGVLQPSIDDLSEPFEDAFEEDPELALGITFLLPKSQQSAWLALLREKHPDHLLVLTVSLGGSEEESATALEKLIRLEPHNLYYRLMERRRLDKAAHGRVLPGDEKPYDPEVVEELLSWTGPEFHFDCHAQAFARAQQRAIDTLNLPFPSVINDHCPSMNTEWYRTFRTLKVTCLQLLEKGERAKAEALQGLGMRVGRQASRQFGTLIDALLGQTTELMAALFFKDHFEAQGDAEALGKLERIEASFKARRKKMRQQMMRIAPYGFLNMLPVPSISESLANLSRRNFEQLRHEMIGAVED